MVDLDYRPESLLPPIAHDDIRRAEDFLSSCFHTSRQGRRVTYPASYVEHVLRFHGGVPKKRCFAQPDGERRVLCRFANFLKKETLPAPMIPTWRQCTAEDIRMDYSIFMFMNYDPWCGRLSESGGQLVPFAAIDTAGHDARLMDEFNLLCFDYECEPEPSVVTWCFEMSWSTPEETRLVAASFSEFLNLLHECPSDDEILQEVVGPEYF